MNPLHRSRGPGKRGDVREAAGAPASGRARTEGRPWRAARPGAPSPAPARSAPSPAPPPRRPLPSARPQRDKRAAFPDGRLALLRPPARRDDREPLTAARSGAGRLLTGSRLLPTGVSAAVYQGDKEAEVAPPPSSGRPCLAQEQTAALPPPEAPEPGEVRGKKMREVRLRDTNLGWVQLGSPAWQSAPTAHPAMALQVNWPLELGIKAEQGPVQRTGVNALDQIADRTVVNVDIYTNK
ncbi:uncharacterized protein LOC105866286 [Microcebus murinus]|uniref:uncharacterized protein LOC105866286 n=1 Tax=Microcebus murinus TaxID=30608 RepID=UPI003F6B2933